MEVTASVQHMYLVQLPDRILLQMAKEKECLSLSDSGECSSSSLKMELVPVPVLDAEVLARRCFGVVGILRFSLGRFLLAITERELVGSVRGKNVWRALTVEAIPIPLVYDGGSLEQIKAFELHVANLKAFLQDAMFYYSYDWNFSHTQQRISQLSVDRKCYQWEVADERFFWNMSVALPFCRAGAGFERFVVVVVDGFFQSQVCSLYGVNARFTLISRRSRHRAGTRFLTRGIDPLGHVANFVETEQILELMDSDVVYSWVTVRGSIPVFWSQLGSERIPLPVVHYGMFSSLAFRRHLTELQATYGKALTLVNLIEQSGKEAQLGEAYEMAVRLFGGDDTRYVSVDFHQLTKGDRYEELNKLMDILTDDVSDMLWFSCVGGETKSTQRGVFRTNCIDCLDRTNVVQALLGRFVLHHQLCLHDLAHPSKPLQSEFLSVFNSVWTDNADAISHRYTGAAAMKTDFTRTGQRGLRGQLQDGITAAERFIEQTLRDPSKQDAINLFLGKYFSRRIPGLGPAAVAADGIRVKAYKRSTWKPAVEFPIAFELNGKDILVFDWEGQKVRVFPVSTLVSITSATSDTSVLVLRFNASTSAKVFRFQNAIVKHKILLMILKQAPHLASHPVLEASDGRPAAPLEVFVGSLNMVGVGMLRSVEEWIPAGKDLYIVSVLNAIFPSPDAFVLFGAQYLFFQVLKFLGPEYQCCASTESATGDGTLVVCRVSLMSRLSNVEIFPITRAARRNAQDSDWLKRASRASRAHRDVARSKSHNRLDSIGSPTRRRGTVDIQKELTLVATGVSFCLDDGPVMYFVNASDASHALPTSLKSDCIIGTGFFDESALVAADGTRFSVVASDKTAGSIAMSQSVFPSFPFLTNVQGSTCKLECDEYALFDIGGTACEMCDEISSINIPCSKCGTAVCHYCRLVDEKSPDHRICRKCFTAQLQGRPDGFVLMVPDQSDSGTDSEIAASVANLPSSTGTDATLNAVKASIDRGDQGAKTRPGIVRVLSTSGLVPIPPERVSPRTSGSGPQSCVALRSTFLLTTSVVGQSVLESDVVVELVNVRACDWVNTAAVPFRLRLELASSILHDEKFQTEASDSGTWASLILRPWIVSEALAKKTLALTLTGIPGGSTLGGFFSSITGVSQTLAVSKLPLWPAFDKKANGEFSIPLYAPNADSTMVQTLFGFLKGQLRLKPNSKEK